MKPKIQILEYPTTKGWYWMTGDKRTKVRSEPVIVRFCDGIVKFMNGDWMSQVKAHQRRAKFTPVDHNPASINWELS